LVCLEGFDAFELVFVVLHSDEADDHDCDDRGGGGDDNFEGLGHFNVPF